MDKQALLRKSSTRVFVLEIMHVTLRLPCSIGWHCTHGRRPAGTHMAGALPARALHPTAGILGARADSIVASPKYVKWWVSEI